MKLTLFMAAAIIAVVSFMGCNVENPLKDVSTENVDEGFSIIPLDDTITDAPGTRSGIPYIDIPYSKIYISIADQDAGGKCISFDYNAPVNAEYIGLSLPDCLSWSINIFTKKIWLNTYNDPLDNCSHNQIIGDLELYFLDSNGNKVREKIDGTGNVISDSAPIHLC